MSLKTEATSQEQKEEELKEQVMDSIEYNPSTICLISLAVDSTIFVHTSDHGSVICSNNNTEKSKWFRSYPISLNSDHNACTVALKSADTNKHLQLGMDKVLLECKNDFQWQGNSVYFTVIQQDKNNCKFSFQCQVTASKCEHFKVEKEGNVFRFKSVKYGNNPQIYLSAITTDTTQLVAPEKDWKVNPIDCDQNGYEFKVIIPKYLPPINYLTLLDKYIYSVIIFIFSIGFTVYILNRFGNDTQTEDDIAWLCFFGVWFIGHIIFLTLSYCKYSEEKKKIQKSKTDIDGGDYFELIKNNQNSIVPDYKEATEGDHGLYWTATVVPPNHNSKENVIERNDNNISYRYETVATDDNEQ